MRVGAFALLAMSLIAGGWAGVVAANEQFVGWHDKNYVRQVEFTEKQEAMMAAVQRERRSDEFDETEDEILFLEGAILIKQARSEDPSLEELSLKQAERKYDRLRGQLNNTSIGT